MVLAIRGNNAVHPVVGNNISVDNKVIRVDKFITNLECCIQRKVCIAHHQINDTLDATVDM